MFSKSPIVLIGTTTFINSSSHYPPRLMEKSLSRPASTTSFASTTSSNEKCCKPRILCLHGKFQSAAVFSNKIAGARRKIERAYDLHFLNGPIILEPENEDARAWWLRLEDGSHTMVQEAFDYVVEQTRNENYDAIIGFSQGGTLATALALSGVLPNVKAVVTAGAPHIQEAFEVANKLAESQANWSVEVGRDIPKIHLAGETDSMVSLDWTRELVEVGGNGKFIIHEQGHLFPTRSARVNEILEFLGSVLLNR
jgi:predicted esterase